MPTLEKTLKDFQTYELIFNHAGEKYLGSTINIVQADKQGRKLAITLRNTSTPHELATLQPYFSYQHTTTDAIQGTVLCTYNKQDNQFVVTLPQSMNEFGTYSCDLTLRDDAGNVFTTRPFAIFVERSALKVAAVYNNQGFKLFLDALAKVDAGNNAINALIDEKTKAVDAALSKAQTDLGKQQANFDSKLVEWNKKVDEAINRVLAKSDLTKAQADTYYIKKQPQSVQSENIATYAVTADKLSSNSVISDKIAYSAINTNHIAKGAINLAALAPNLGVIVEYQSNTKACAVKYSNGFMICAGTEKISSNYQLSQWGSMWSTKEYLQSTFLVPFVDAPICMVSHQASDYSFLLAPLGKPTTTQTQRVYFCRPDNSPDGALTFSYIALGKWKA